MDVIINLPSLKIKDVYLNDDKLSYKGKSITMSDDLHLKVSSPLGAMEIFFQSVLTIDMALLSSATFSENVAELAKLVISEEDILTATAIIKGLPNTQYDALDISGTTVVYQQSQYEVVDKSFVIDHTRQLLKSSELYIRDIIPDIKGLGGIRDFKKYIDLSRVADDARYRINRFGLQVKDSILTDDLKIIEWLASQVKDDETSVYVSINNVFDYDGYIMDIINTADAAIKELINMGAILIWQGDIKIPGEKTKYRIVLKDLY